MNKIFLSLHSEDGMVPEEHQREPVNLQSGVIYKRGSPSSRVTKIWHLIWYDLSLNSFCTESSLVNLAQFAPWHRFHRVSFLRLSCGQTSYLSVVPPGSFHLQCPFSLISNSRTFSVLAFLAYPCLFFA